jgi:hypothetical protein
MKSSPILAQALRKHKTAKQHERAWRGVSTMISSRNDRVEERVMVVTSRVLAAGERLPDVALPLLDGGELAVGDLRGKKLLLFFWGSW